MLLSSCLSYSFEICSRTVLSLCLHGRNSKLNSKLINEAILLLSYKIKCVFKTPLHKSSYNYDLLDRYLYAWSPKAKGIHFKQITSAYVLYCIVRKFGGDSITNLMNCLWFSKLKLVLTVKLYWLVYSFTNLFAKPNKSKFLMWSVLLECLQNV